MKLTHVKGFGDNDLLEFLLGEEDESLFQDVGPQVVHLFAIVKLHQVNHLTINLLPVFVVEPLLLV